MNTVYEIIGWVSIPVTLVSVVYMVVTWHRERTLSARSLWIPILVSSLSLFLYVRLANLEVRPLVTWLPFFVALGLGLYIGHLSRVEARDESVVAARNPWSFVLWAASFVATQLVALLAPERTDTMVGLLFAATGLTIGEQLALISARSSQLGKMRAATAAAAAVFLVVVFGAALAPRQSHAADVSTDLGAATKLENVVVDIRGVPDGTYSGSSIDVTIENTTSDTLKVRVPVGTQLIPGNDAIQTMLTAGDEVIEVPPGQTVKKRIQAYCGEANDGAPTDADSFTVGEVTSNPALRRSLQEMSRRFNDPDPDRPVRPSEWQRHGVWVHTNGDQYAPPAEGEPGYDIFNPTQPGPTTEETGKGGGGVSAANLGGVALATKPGGKQGGKGPKKGPGKPGTDDGSPPWGEPDDAESTAGAGESSDSGATDSAGESGDGGADDGSPPWGEPDDAGSTAGAGESGDGGGDADDTGGDTDDTGQTDDTDDAGETETETTEETTDEPAEDEAEKPTLYLGPLTIKPGEYQLNTGGGKFDYDAGEKTLTYDDPNVSAGYDFDDNIGTFMSKDGSLTLDTQPGQFDLVTKDDAGTTTRFTGKKGGGKTSLTMKIEPTDGRRVRIYDLSSGPSGISGGLKSGDRTDRFHFGPDSRWWEHVGPDVQWKAGEDPDGLVLRYRHTSQVRMGKLGKVDWQKGLSYQGDDLELLTGFQKAITVKGNPIVEVGVHHGTDSGVTYTIQHTIDL